MLKAISKQTAECLSDSTDTTTLLGDYLRDEGIIGFEYRIENAYQEIALNNLKATALTYAQQHEENITSLQQLVYILLNELQIAEHCSHSNHIETPNWAKLVYMWNTEMMPKMEQVLDSYNTDLEAFIYGWAICKGASVGDATSFSIKCAHSIEFGV